jgi:hypothetical protein
MFTEIVEFGVYLFRRIRREQRLRTAVGWTPTRAQIVSTKAFGGKTTVLYTYQFAGEYFSNCETRDFFWSQSASNYVKGLDRFASLVIRVNSAKPEESVIFDEDQKEPTRIVMKESVS